MRKAAQVCVFFVAATFLVGALIPQEAMAEGTLVQLTSGPNPFGPPHLYQDRAGKYFVATAVNIRGQEDIVLLTSENGREWSAPRQITNLRDAFKPFLCQDHRGRYWVAFGRRFGTAYDVYIMHSDDAVNWSTPTPVVTGSTHQFGESLIVDSHGKLWLAYNTYSATFVKYSSDGVTWSGSYPASPSGWWVRASLIQDQAGSYWIAYDTRTVGPYVAHSSDGTHWGTPKPVTTHHGSAASLMQDSSSVYHMAYAVQFSSTWNDIFTVSSSDGSGWSTPKPFEGNTAGYEGYPSLLQDKAGVRWMAFLSDRAGGTNHVFLWRSVANMPPSVEIGDHATSNEGDTFARVGTFTDPDSTSWTATVDYGDGGGEQPLPLNPDRTFTLSHAYADNGAYPVTVKVKDDGGAEGSATLTVTVLNVPPTAEIKAIIPPVPDFILPGDLIQFQGDYTDPGTADTHTFEWDFGDGSQKATTQNAQHAYDAPGSYTLTFTVQDDDGDAGEHTATVDVLNPTQGLDRVIDVISLTEAPLGTKEALSSKLENAIKSIEKGKKNAAINQIEAFINQVEAQSGKKLTKEEADQLIERATRIIEVMSQPMARVLRYDGVPIPGAMVIFTNGESAQTDKDGYFAKLGTVFLITKAHAGQSHWLFKKGAQPDQYQGAYAKFVQCQQLGVSVYTVVDVVFLGTSKPLTTLLKMLIDVKLGVKALQDLDDIHAETQDGLEAYVTGWTRGYVEVAVGNFDLIEALLPVDASISTAIMVAKHPDHDPKLDWAVDLELLDVGNILGMDISASSLLWPEPYASGDVVANVGVSSSVFSLTLFDFTVQTPADCTEYKALFSNNWTALATMALRTSLHADNSPMTSLIVRPLVERLARAVGLWRKPTGTNENEHGNWSLAP